MIQNNILGGESSEKDRLISFLGGFPEAPGLGTTLSIIVPHVVDYHEKIWRTSHIRSKGERETVGAGELNTCIDTFRTHGSLHFPREGRR